MSNSPIIPSQLECALALRARGFSIIPVPYPRPGVPKNTPGDGKTPEIRWKKYQTHRPTEDEIREWFDVGPMNLAVITGVVSGIVVVDCDDRRAIRWWVAHRPFTPWQVRTARGWHLYYQHPGGRVPNRQKLVTRDGQMEIDARGDGGFVIGPGSVHATGALYEWAGDWTAAREALPRFWPGWAPRKTRPATSDHSPRSRRPTGDVVERARRYLAVIPKPEIGSGSDGATFVAACRIVRGFALSEALAIDLIWEWAGHRPGWTREWVATKVTSAGRYGTETIGGLLG